MPFWGINSGCIETPYVWFFKGGPISKQQLEQLVFNSLPLYGYPKATKENTHVIIDKGVVTINMVTEELRSKEEAIKEKQTLVVKKDELLSEKAQLIKKERYDEISPIDQEIKGIDSAIQALDSADGPKMIKKDILRTFPDGIVYVSEAPYVIVYLKYNFSEMTC